MSTITTRGLRAAAIVAAATALVPATAGAATRHVTVYLVARLNRIIRALADRQPSGREYPA